MNELPLPAVTRYKDRHGDYVRPPLEQNWDEAIKLAWQAAVVAHDTGLRIHVFEGVRVVGGEPVPGTYGLTVGHHGVSPFDYRTAWEFLNGVATGAAPFLEVEEFGQCPNCGTDLDE